jgi:hypothetical protein
MAWEVPTQTIPQPPSIEEAEIARVWLVPIATKESSE